MDKSLSVVARTRIIGKRLGRFAVPVMLAVIAVGAFASISGGIPEARALGGQLFGQPRDIHFNNAAANHPVTDVEVLVAKGWLNSDAFSLEIEINSANGVPRYHGTKAFPLNGAKVLATHKGYAVVALKWDVDDDPDWWFSEEYTVCVQVLAMDTPVGDRMCNVFDPYF